MSHHVVKCKGCKAVMSQCRCSAKDKEVRWAVCGHCMAEALHEINCANEPKAKP